MYFRDTVSLLEITWIIEVSIEPFFPGVPLLSYVSTALTVDFSLCDELDEVLVNSSQPL